MNYFNPSKYHFSDIEKMPEIPQLSIPDYAGLNASFRTALMDPKNEAFRYNAENGHPNFGAYLQSGSNEMVTWGILAVGEWLCNRDTKWIAPTYYDFFSEEFNIYINSPDTTRVEYWYLFYVNTLAGAVMKTLYKGDTYATSKIGKAADAMYKLAQALNYDFNGQGYDFGGNSEFTVKDIYRQPDSIGGYAYNMLFAARNADRSDYITESHKAIKLYEAFTQNPWYEIPNGSAALMASSWLNSHGYETDVAKTAGFMFDNEHGPLQVGTWSGEEVNGLMMGWRGETREMAANTAYSMESLMPVQFALPAVRYCPGLADSVSKYLLNLLSSFQLFYAKGTKPLYETRPELNASVPYERLDLERDGHSPAACGDFHGHRSVYGAGYLYWIEALAIPAAENIYAYDLSLSDWLADETYPVFLLRNPYEKTMDISFKPAVIWQKKQPTLYNSGELNCDVWDLQSGEKLQSDAKRVEFALTSRNIKMVAVLPCGTTLTRKGDMLMANNVELCAIEE